MAQRLTDNLWLRTTKESETGESMPEIMESNPSQPWLAGTVVAGFAVVGVGAAVVVWLRVAAVEVDGKEVVAVITGMLVEVGSVMPAVPPSHAARATTRTTPRARPTVGFGSRMPTSSSHG